MASQPLQSRRPNFTEAETICLIAAYDARKSRLEGNFEGVGGGKTDRDNAWIEVTNAVNAQQPNVKRSVDEVIKRWRNVKQNSKRKNDEVRRPPTGGGKGPSFSQSEAFYLEKMDGRAVLDGIPGGVETGVASAVEKVSGNQGKSCSSGVAVASAVEMVPDTQEQCCTSGGTVASAVEKVPDTQEQGFSSGRAAIDLEELIFTPADQLSGDCVLLPESSDPKPKRRKVEPSKKTLTQSELESLELEKTKLRLEIKTQMAYLKLLEKKQSLCDTREQYYRRKMSQLPES